MKLSFIIPVFRTPESSLVRCLDSVLSYDGEMEVICVLDSPGHACGEVLAAYAGRDFRVRVLANQRNMGVSFSRNRGIDEATGDVLTFIDSDDVIGADIYRQAMEKMEKRPLDLCVCRFPVDAPSEMADGEYQERELVGHDWRDMKQVVSTIGQACWGILFRKCSVKRRGTRFAEKIGFNEDFMFNVQFMCGGGRFGLLGADGYRRVGSEESVTVRKATAKRILDFLRAQLAMLEALGGDAMPAALRAWYAASFVGNVFGDRHACRLFKADERPEFIQSLSRYIRLMEEGGYLAMCTLPVRTAFAVLRAVPKSFFVCPWLVSYPIAACMKFRRVVRGQ